MPTNNAANFGTGTSGQVLTSNGTGVAPTFQNPAGVFQLIQAQGLSGASSADFTNLGSYAIIMAEYYVTPGTNTDALQLLVSTNGGSSYLGSGNYNAGINYYADNSTTLNNINTTSYFPIGGPCVNVSNTSGYFNLNSLSGTTQIYGQSVWNDSTLGQFAISQYAGSSVTGVNALRFKYSTGTMSGQITLYGIKQA